MKNTQIDKNKKLLDTVHGGFEQLINDSEYDVRLTIGQIEEICASGAEINATDERGQTVLHIAALQGDQLLIDSLISHRINLNLQDENGKTALHIAAFLNDTKVFEQLLRAGASNGIKDKDGKTPLDLFTTVEIRDAAVDLIRNIQLNSQINNVQLEPQRQGRDI